MPLPNGPGLWSGGYRGPGGRSGCYIYIPRFPTPVLSLPYRVQQYGKFCPLLPNWGSAAGPLGHPFPDRVGLPMASVVWLVRV